MEEHLLRQPLALVPVGSGQISSVQGNEVVEPGTGIPEPCVHIVGLKRHESQPRSLRAGGNVSQVRFPPPP
jgi:hypothetical protein